MAYEPTSALAPNAVRRYKDRAHYDEETIHGILDKGVHVAHVTFRLPENDGPDDWPVIIPMIYGRKDQTIYLHGHLTSRLLKALSDENVKACVAVTSVQGLVVSLSSFGNSNNYTSCALFGHARLITDLEEKIDALKLTTNSIFSADRWTDSREPTSVDIQSTQVVALQIEMASAKVREGAPKDDRKDVDNVDVSGKYWSGVVVREDRWSDIIPSEYCSVETPDYIKQMLS